jgi:hypothetical protein
VPSPLWNAPPFLLSLLLPVSLPVLSFCLCMNVRVGVGEEEGDGGKVVRVSISLGRLAAI